MAGKTKNKPKEETIEFSNNFTWSHVTKKITELKPYEFNPRNITDKGLADLEKSIGKFGLAEPIAINTNGTIIGGHARYFALKKHGVKEVNCYEPDHELSEQEMKELNIRLNKNIAGDWDFDILANEFDLPELLEWGFSDADFGIGAETDFPELPEGDREPFQQMTFTLADKQAEVIKNALADMKHTENYKYAEALGNENSNGNALYLIVSEWAEQRT